MSVPVEDAELQWARTTHESRTDLCMYACAGWWGVGGVEVGVGCGETLASMACGASGEETSARVRESKEQRCCGITVSGG